MSEGKEIPPEYTDRKIRALAKKLIHEQTTMTLATAHRQGAWAAPVYYVFHKGAFFFFSDPASRHIREALDSGQAAGAISAPASTWEEIQGMQMSGSVRRIAGPLEAAPAIFAYLAKFPFTKDFFKAGVTPDLETFGARFRVALYRFKPTLIYYLNNRIRFGFRREIGL